MRCSEDNEWFVSASFFSLNAFLAANADVLWQFSTASRLEFVNADVRWPAAGCYSIGFAQMFD